MNLPVNQVTEWLREQDDAVSVAGTDVGAVPSEFGDLDVDKYYVDESQVLGSRAVDGDVREGVRDALEAVACGAQRMAVAELHRLYAKGRMHEHPDYSATREIPQRFFRVENYMTISSLDDKTLYDALRAGPLVTRLGAVTGLGKTRKLSGMIASKCSLRVCQVEPDVNLSKDASRAQAKAYADVRVSARSWSREKRGYLTVMSYHEFRGIVLSGGRARLFEDFDVFVLDEASLPEAVVYAAQQYFAAYHRPHNSLILASATMSVDASSNVAASGVGRFVENAKPVILEDALQTGELVRDHLRDRMVLLVASDEQVAYARAYLEAEGLDVMTLDRGSIEGDVDVVRERFSAPTSVVPRVLVANQLFGLGYNVPLSYVVSTATIRVYEFDESNALVEKEIPIMGKMATQHKGRTGRGLAHGSGGWMMRTDYSPDRELLHSEVLEAYLSLVAAGIRPRPGLFDSVIKVLPFGINKQVAKSILGFALPPGLIIRYLGSDGRFARRFVKAIEVFSQRGDALLPSKDLYPVGYESWISETVGGYYVGDESSVDYELRVPFKSPPGLRIVMHALSAMEGDLITVPRWVPDIDDEVSDDDKTGVRKKVKFTPRALPRVVEDQVSTVVSTVQEDAVWAYAADPSKARTKKKRSGLSWDPAADASGAMAVLLRALRDGDLGIMKASPQLGVPEYGDAAVYSLPLEDVTEIIVESPGGGKILLVAIQVHECWMRGVPMSPEGFSGVLKALRDLKAVKRFAKATVFDNWSPAWLSWFSTYAETEVVRAAMRDGVQRVAVELLGYLYDRFRAEVFTVANSSAVYKDAIGGFFRKTPSLSKFASAYRRGMAPIAQSDKFIARVLQIKDLHDRAVLAIEDVGLFAPHQVTKAQHRLPLSDSSRRLTVIDARVATRPKGSRSLDIEEEKWNK